MPFEDTSRSFLARVGATLGTAFRPRETARCFTKCRPELAVRFLLISALPLSLAAGVIPHTQTLLFGPGLQLSIVGKSGSADIVVDVLRAMLIQLLFDTGFLAAIALPFVTLVKSYGRGQCASSALGMMLYRYWLMPAALLLSYLAFWMVPDPNIGTVTQFILSILSLYFLVRSMWTTATTACGVKPLWSIAVVGVPWILVFVVIALIAPLVIQP